MTEMERRIEVYKKEAETARKWSASLANLHHIKVRFLICFMGLWVETSGSEIGFGRVGLTSKWVYKKEAETARKWSAS